MSFLSISAMFIVSFLIFLALVMCEWRKFNNPLGLNVKILAGQNYLSRIWFTDIWAINFSLSRHAIVAILIAAEFWFVGIGWLNTVLLWMNLLYAMIRIPLFLQRRREGGEMVEKFSEFKHIVRVCNISALYPFVVQAMLYFAYYKRP